MFKKLLSSIASKTKEVVSKGIKENFKNIFKTIKEKVVDKKDKEEKIKKDSVASEEEINMKWLENSKNAFINVFSKSSYAKLSGGYLVAKMTRLLNEMYEQNPQKLNMFLRLFTPYLREFYEDSKEFSDQFDKVQNEHTLRQLVSMLEGSKSMFDFYGNGGKYEIDEKVFMMGQDDF